MATNHRLFVEETLATNGTVGLSEQASHYLIRVLRLRSGAQVTLFNGDGNNYSAEIVDANKTTARLRILGDQAGPHSTPELNLAIALLKGDKLDFALQKATELDAANIWLTKTSRCELRLSDKRLANRMLHWQRIIVSACEQSGRTYLPKLHPPQPLQSVLIETAAMQRYCMSPDAPAGELCVSDKNLCLFTGPEGGFDSTEAELMQSHCESVQLGELVLRAETAPLVGLALLGAARRRKG